MTYPEYIERDYDYPLFYDIRMNYPCRPLKDPYETVVQTIREKIDRTVVRAGDTVAVCVGSRGISGLATLVKAVCDVLKDHGAHPFIVPAMGSHGGATGEGQAGVLESLGVSSGTCGVPVVSTMDVTRIGEVLDRVPVYFSKDCLVMDHCVCINRIKPHTKFKGPVESGIFKMLCIGMGKHEGALALHQASLRHGFSKVIEQAGRTVIQTANLAFAVAVVEGFHDEVTAIETILPGDIYGSERKLLEMAKQQFPRLPFDRLDVLIVGSVGKEISGSGMDPNVTGRAYDLMEDDFSGILDVTRIAILDLTDGTAGNAIGIGNADIITESVYRKMDYEKTLINALTSTSLRKAFIPVRLPDDRRAVNAALMTTGKTTMEDLRVVIIRDTRHLTQFWVSSALLNEVKQNQYTEITGQKKLSFDQAGSLDLMK